MYKLYISHEKYQIKNLMHTDNSNYASKYTNYMLRFSSVQH